MAEAKEKKDQIFYAGVSVRFSKLLANAFFKAGLGFYARPNSKGDRILLCLMNKKDVITTLKNPDDDPDWDKTSKLNVNTSRKIKNKGEAIMLGDKIKFLIAHNANLSIDQNGNLKDEGNYVNLDSNQLNHLNDLFNCSINDLDFSTEL